MRMTMAMVAGAAAAMLCASAPGAAQGSYSPYDETASDALARYVRTLAQNPKDFSTLISAGKAALTVGDTEAAAGFFARADDVNPRSPLPQAGMGAVSVGNGEPNAAIPYFTRAAQLGAPVVTFACDRGLAFDLLGRQADAQADYRLALNGPDAEEARRRLALSLAISGKRDDALTTLAPLIAKNDAGARRARAFVLALSGDSLGARQAIDAAMPGAWASVSPLVQQLVSLKAGDQAAAVNLGIFPDSSGSTVSTFAYSAPVPTFQAPRSAPVTTVGSDRLAGMDALMRGRAAPVAAAPATPPVQVAYARPPAVVAAPAQAMAVAPTAQQKKIWLQLASGSNAAALPGEFRRIKGRNRELFDGIKGYVASSTDKARLVIGPFHANSDAEIFAEDLESIGVNSFRWTNSETDRIVPLGTE